VYTYSEIKQLRLQELQEFQNKRNVAIQRKAIYLKRYDLSAGTVDRNNSIPLLVRLYIMLLSRIKFVVRLLRLQRADFTTEDFAKQSRSRGSFLHFLTLGSRFTVIHIIANNYPPVTYFSVTLWLTIVKSS